MSKMKLGVSLFSYGTEYARQQYDFEECVKQAALAGAAGYEIVGAQMIPSYPNISDEFLRLVEDLRVKYGIGPEGYGASNDKGVFWDRNLNDEELLAGAIHDLKAANKLGCKVMRAQYMLGPAAFERLAPYAELYDVKVGIEIHNPDTPSSPHIQEYLNIIKKTGSKHLGFVQDFGFLAVAPNKPKWDRALSLGVKEEHLVLAADMRYAGVALSEAMAKLQEAGAHPAINESLQGMYGYVQFRPKEALPELLQEMKDILPYTFEMHTKFHYLSEDCVEPSIPYIEILEFLKDTEFDGYLMSEYEDEAYCGGELFTKRHLEMERRILGL